MRSRTPMVPGLLLLAVLGAAAFEAAPSPGTFTGSTDQGRAFGVTVAADQAHVTQLSLDVKITNPAGCSVTVTANRPAQVRSAPSTACPKPRMSSATQGS